VGIISTLSEDSDWRKWPVKRAAAYAEESDNLSEAELQDLEETYCKSAWISRLCKQDCVSCSISQLTTYSSQK
jgi:hypothetical protein